MSKSEHQGGLYKKYVVRRTDGGSRKGRRHESCRYFVLDLTHDHFAVPAIKAYAAACRVDYPRLAEDLTAWLSTKKPLTYEVLGDAATEMLAALRKIVEMNLATARDKFGDASKAENWACVRVAREAIAKAGEPH